MTQVMRALPSLVGNVLLSPTVRIDRATCRPSSSRVPHLLATCSLESIKCSPSSAESSRRNFVISTASLAAAVAFVNQPDAQAAKRKPPPPPAEKPSLDEKSLSAYDARILANLRRKEALKALVETQKAKAKIVRDPSVDAPTDIFGKAPTESSGPAPETSVPEPSS